MEFSQATGAKFEEGGGAGSTVHPMAEGEEEKKPFETDLGFARVRDDPEAPGGIRITMDKEAMEVFTALGSGLPKRSASTTKAAKPAGSRKIKRKKLVRLDKERIEIKLMGPPPRPYTFISSDPTLRALDLKYAAIAQKKIDRYAEMLRQYEIQGYADLEYTDPEDNDDYDEVRVDWRPWAYLKEVGLAD